MYKSVSNFNLDKISKSGQCFMINKISDLTESYGFSTYNVQDFNLSTSVDVYKDNRINIHGFDEEVVSKMKNYLSINDKDDYTYQIIYDRVASSNDEFLIKCMKYGYGLRILRQDPWQTLISFIISQQNNISKIKSTIKKICDENNSQFPSPQGLNKFTDSQFSRCSLGYREKYVRKAAEIMISNPKLLDDLFMYKTDDLIDKLISTFPGVGIKIASCVALYAYNRLSVFPVDVWISRILKETYRCDDKEFLIDILPENLREFAGVIQLYMYYYSLNHKSEFL